MYSFRVSDFFHTLSLQLFEINIFALQKGRTALDAARQHGKADIVQILSVRILIIRAPVRCTALA
jgi:hypothetical protein